MKREELLSKHDHYASMIDDWNLCAMAYTGGETFIKYAIGTKNRLESQANYEKRIREGINFNYIEAIVDLFNFYLTEKTPIRNLPFLKNDIQWKMFLKDSDLKGTDFNLFINEAQKVSSYQGALGLLIDKPQSQFTTKKEEISKRVYPYIAPFTLPNVYNFKYERDESSGRPIMTYLKLKGENNQYYIWHPGYWEIWQDTGNKKDPELIKSGEYDFKEIPFVWLQNLKNIVRPYFGKSDVTDISRIVASIIRNISMGEEIIEFAGFPMMRVPMQVEGTEEQNQTGPEPIWQFDPEHGAGGKPDWMETEIKEPIEAILMWIDKKIDEIYRIVHLSGVHGQRTSTNSQKRSGLALRYEFQQLISVLGKKANNMAEAEYNIVKYWCMWQNVDFDEEAAEIKHKKDFSVDDLSINLDNLIKSMKWVASKKFKVMSQQHIAKQTLPDASEKDKADIMKEIEDSKGALPENTTSPTNQKVRSASKAVKGKPEPTKSAQE